VAKVVQLSALSRDVAVPEHIRSVSNFALVRLAADIAYVEPPVPLPGSEAVFTDFGDGEQLADFDGELLIEFA
jgi:hypothetical protein